MTHLGGSAGRVSCILQCHTHTLRTLLPGIITLSPLITAALIVTVTLLCIGCSLVCSAGLSLTSGLGSTHSHTTYTS